MKIIITFLITLLISTSQVMGSAIDFDQFDLTPQQREVLLRLEQRGIDRDVLLQTAQAFENSNRPSNVYIPDHTQELLFDLSRWAQGEAFSAFAKRAGFEFDYRAYLDDCPSWEVFNFARATGTAYIQHDVLNQYANMYYALANAHTRSPETFSDVYQDFIKRARLEHYLK